MAKDFLEITKNTYDKMATIYFYADRSHVKEDVTSLYDKLFETAQKIIHKPIEEMSVLDVGTGTGEAIKKIYSRGVKKVIGLDNSDGIIKILRELQERKEIPKDSFMKGDMLELPFDDNSFEIVRQNASLLHLPMTTKGEMLDKAIQENYRVLKENGILFISVKKGKGLQLIDTKDGVGGRIFQMHTVESITTILKENKFKILDIIEVEERRFENVIEWINVIAKK